MQRHLIPTALTVVAALASAPFAGASETRYVALGDSYSAGTGTYTSATSLDAACHRSTGGHPYQLGVSEADYRACAGATTTSLLTQVPSATGATDVTLTIGGNDAQFATAMSWCTAITDVRSTGETIAVKRPGCATSLFLTSLVDAGRVGLSGRVTAGLKAIKAAAPGASIRVAGYPQLFGPFTGTCTVARSVTATDTTTLWVSRGDADWLNSKARQVDDQIRAGVAAAVSAGVNATYVDVDGYFVGHRLCDQGDSYVNGVVGGTVEASDMTRSYHLNAGGEAAYRTAYQASGLAR